MKRTWSGFSGFISGGSSEDELFALYANAALGGFLWCCGLYIKVFWEMRFGEYTIIMYRYAKKYYRKLRKL